MNLTNIKRNQWFLKHFRARTRRIRWAGLALITFLFGFLLPARGQDPRLTNTNHPADTNVSLGATVRFQVLASTTNGPLTYQWQHAGTNLPVATNASLVISNATEAHAGGYMAWITNAMGDFTNSRTAILTVDTTFTQITSNALVTNTIMAWNACWIDYDGDGCVDFFVVPGGDQLALPSLYHNEGNGTFRKVTTNVIAQTAVRAYTFVWGDYDNDGRPDLFVPNTGTMNDMLFHNDGNGKFTRIMTGPLVSDGADSVNAAWVDYDRDGFLDLFVSTRACQNDILYRNNRDGTFRKMTAAEVGPVVNDLAYGDYFVWADVDGDARSELSRTMKSCVSGSSWTNEVWHVDNQGKFYLMDIGEMKQGLAGFTIATWADYDNDGFPDAVVLVENGPTSFYRSLAGRGFTNITASVFPTAITNGYPWFLGDYDNDGWLDLVLQVGAGNPSPLYRNNRDGTFTRQYVGSLTSVPDGGPIWGDYDNDGFLDTWVWIGANTKNLLFQNSGNSNHWLKVKLDGRASNRSGIGAKVRVQATIGGRTFWQMREISGQGIGLDNGLLAHFGLGDATNVTTLRIEWPSGIVQELHDVASKQFLTVVESQNYTNTPPAFAGATRTASGLQLSFNEPAAGFSYVLEASTDLITWTKLMACTSAGNTTQFTDTNSTNYPGRYYRIQVP